MKFTKKIIFYLPVNTDTPNFRCFLILVVVGTAASFGFSKLSPNETPFDSRPKTMNGQGIIPSLRSQAKRVKIAIDRFGY